MSKDRKITISRALLERAAAALEESAQMEAGQSQDSTLINKEETQQWEDAQMLRLLIADDLLYVEVFKRK